MIDAAVNRVQSFLEQAAKPQRAEHIAKNTDLEVETVYEALVQMSDLGIAQMVREDHRHHKGKYGWRVIR